MEANIKIVQAIYTAFGRGDVAAILAMLAEDVSWLGTEAPELPYSGALHGRAGVERFFAGIGGSIEVTSFEPKTFLADGDAVMVTGAWAGKVRATGKPFQARWAMRWVIRDGKVASYEGFEDTAIVAAALRD